MKVQSTVSDASALLNCLCSMSKSSFCVLIIVPSGLLICEYDSGGRSLIHLSASHGLFIADITFNFCSKKALCTILVVALYSFRLHLLLCASYNSFTIWNSSIHHLVGFPPLFPFLQFLNHAPCTSTSSLSHSSSSFSFSPLNPFAHLRIASPTSLTKAVSSSVSIAIYSLPSLTSKCPQLTPTREWSDAPLPLASLVYTKQLALMQSRRSRTRSSTEPLPSRWCHVASPSLLMRSMSFSVIVSSSSSAIESFSCSLSGFHST